MRDKIGSLQVVRFAAASLVIALHCIEVLGTDTIPKPIDGLGPLGVDLFFVLSGYIMATVATGSSARDFLARRLTRILPLYYLLTLAFVGEMTWAHKLDPRPWVTSLFMVPVPGEQPYLNVAWTLDYEILFYLAFAVVLAARARGLILVLALLGVSLLGRLWLGGPIFAFTGNPIILEFLLGVMAAKARKDRRVAAMAAIGSVLGLAWIASHAFIADDWLRVAIAGPSCALMIYAAAQVNTSARLWAAAIYLGDASYAAYLVHQFPLSIARALRGSAPIILAAVVAFLICWGLAVLVHEAVEKPLLQRLRRPSPSPRPQFA